MTSRPAREWFDAPLEGESQAGLRFNCTLCGACCTGPPGYILLSDDETDALAERLGLSREQFETEYTHEMARGRSLNEKLTEHGYDCVFLDRETIPGKAVCGVYEDRPVQCRTWPFWSSNLETKRHWDRAARSCPGMNKGKLIPPDQVRIHRERIDM